MKNRMVVVRSRDAGVFFGKLIKKVGDEVLLKGARRVYYWKGANTLSQMAMEGVKYPTECKITQPTDSHIVLGVCEVIEMSKPAIKSLNEVAPWKL